MRLTLLLLLLVVSASRADVRWNMLPPLPDPHGVGGAFAGSSNGALLVAGGANFPNGMPWDGGSKSWQDEIFALRTLDGSWTVAGRLPTPLAYGVSVTTPEGVLCIGGSGSTAHYTDVLRLRWLGEAVEAEALAPLPFPLANMAGAAVDNMIYVVGGSRSPDSTVASSQLLAFDGKAWHELEPLPAPGRIFPIAAAFGGEFYVFSGASLAGDAEGMPVRTYLRDAWKYAQSRGWIRLADLPRPAVAAPSPARAIGSSRLVILGGDDGSLVNFQPRSAHPGFARDLLAYDTVTNTWASGEGLPDDIAAPVTAPVVDWQGSLVIPSGEIRPAVRSPQILAGIPVSSKADFGVINWLVVCAYLGGMIGIGVWFMRREAASSTEAYFRGGQRIPAWVAGLSIFATMLSALTFMGIPARAYSTDITWYIGQLPILLVVPLVACCYLPFFRKLDLTSAYEYLERRFSLPCRLFASLSFNAFHLGRIAIVLYLPALALAAVSDIDVITAVVVIGLLCVVYTVIGGIEAVVWTDAVQALVLMGGALLCFGFAVHQFEGGISGIYALARADNKLLGDLQWTTFDVSAGTTSAIVLFVAFFFNTLVPYTSSQDVVQRYVTTRDLPAAKRSLKVTMWMSVFGSLTFFLLGTAITRSIRAIPSAWIPPFRPETRFCHSTSSTSCRQESPGSSSPPSSQPRSPPFHPPSTAWPPRL